MDFTVKIESKLEFFVKLVSILSLANPVKKLRPKERLLLSYLLFYNDKYKELDIEDRSRIIFDKSIRLDISEAMNIDPQTFYNNKSQFVLSLNEKYKKYWKSKKYKYLYQLPQS